MRVKSEEQAIKFRNHSERDDANPFLILLKNWEGGFETYQGK